MFSMVKPWTAPIDVEEQEKKGYIGVPINFFGLYKYRTNTRSSWIKNDIQIRPEYNPSSFLFPYRTFLQIRKWME